MNASTRRLSLLLLLALAALAAGAFSRSVAAASDPGGFYFSQSQYFVDENGGKAVITVERHNTASSAVVRFLTLGQTASQPDYAEAPYFFSPVKSGVNAPDLNFAPGQASATFTVPIVDHGFDSLASDVQLSLYGGYPIGLAEPSTATLTILDTDPNPTVDPRDPLGLPNAMLATDPLAGAKLFVDPDDEAAVAAKSYPAIAAIAQQPGAARFGSFSYPDASRSVSTFLARAQYEQPGTIPVLTTYMIVNGHCGRWSDPPARQLAYHNWIEGLAQGIGDYRAVLALEQDSLITTGCLSRHGLAVRMAELRDAVNVLTANCPNLVIYLDAGAADGLPASRAAHLLEQAGVAKVQGFFLDATHFDWTSREIRYGEQISRLTGGKHFIVNTGESGRGPLVPAFRVYNGNEVLCNPVGRGLGPKPTTETGYHNVDAFLWLDNPGGSSGTCSAGAPPAGVYWPKYALMLIKNADYTVR
jgi:endoglucanase